MREGNVHSAKDWGQLLERVVARYRDMDVPFYFRADAAFARPEIYEYLEAKGFEYAIRLPCNDILMVEIAQPAYPPGGTARQRAACPLRGF